MKHLKKFNEMNNIDMNISGLKCDKCDYSDPSVKLEDYEKSIGRPCPECGESLLTQEDYDGVIQMVQAVEMLNGFSQADLDAIANNLSEEEIDGALDMMNQLKMTKTGDTEDGREKWNMGELPNKKLIKTK